MKELKNSLIKVEKALLVLQAVRILDIQNSNIDNPSNHYIEEYLDFYKEFDDGLKSFRGKTGTKHYDLFKKFVRTIPKSLEVYPYKQWKSVFDLHISKHNERRSLLYKDFEEGMPGYLSRAHLHKELIEAVKSNLYYKTLSKTDFDNFVKNVIEKNEDFFNVLTRGKIKFYSLRSPSKAKRYYDEIYDFLVGKAEFFEYPE